ncbi:MAG: hypothetical protein R6X10_18950 [Desulfobacterales bacterium]
MIDPLDLTAPSNDRDRRSGKDRRLLFQAAYRPEQRCGNDRRKNSDRRKKNLSFLKSADSKKKS